MKRQVTYSFDRNQDANPLSSDHLENVFNLLQSFATEEERSQDAPHPGIKALRHIKGNHFTVEHVDAFRSYIVELGERADERVRELGEERDRLAGNDAFSRRAYDGMIDGIASGRNLALRDLNQFIEEFRDHFEDDIPRTALSL